jgi:AAHS family 4-hydroxybenzoate transporter-like MFS transporter
MLVERVWQALFYVGGSFPIVMAVCVALCMPESVKYLALREQTRAKATKILSRLMPDLSVGPDMKLSIGGEAAYKNFSPKLLFSNGLALITPLLWLCFAVNLMGYYFLVSWMPDPDDRPEDSLARRRGDRPRSVPADG